MKPPFSARFLIDMHLINLAIAFKFHTFGVLLILLFGCSWHPPVERLHSFYRGASKPSQATSTSEFQRRRLGCFGLEECPWKQRSSWLVSESTTEKYGAMCCWLLNKSGLTIKDIFDSKAWLCFFSCVFFYFLPWVNHHVIYLLVPSILSKSKS